MIVVEVNPVAVSVESVAITVDVAVEAVPGVRVKLPESTVNELEVNLST